MFTPTLPPSPENALNIWTSQQELMQEDGGRGEASSREGAPVDIVNSKAEETAMALLDFQETDGGFPCYTQP